MPHPDDVLKRAADLLACPTPPLDRGEVDAFVQAFLDRRDQFLGVCRRHGSPLYVLEPQVLRDRAAQFIAAFEDEVPDLRVYYAVKSNNSPAVAATLAEAGLGLDVSSGRELEMALACGADDIVFSGPGKTQAELALAVASRERVTLLIDSFGELERLEAVAAEVGTTMRAGVRLTTDERGLWRKFGIPLTHLAGFLDAADACPHVRLCGLQFHTSWNLSPAAHVRFITRLGAELGTLDARCRATIEFVDIGGGFWPSGGEWLQPEGTPEGALLRAVGVPAESPRRPHKLPAVPIGEFARQVGAAVRTHLLPHVRCRICAEPGRWLCHDAMHIVLTVVDRKGDDIAITDAGTNALGWERFETDYFPVINLSRPALAERECYVLGSLCTPHDVWGYAYYGTDICPGDILLIPTQGAYTHSLRQEFIKPLPDVAILPDAPLDLPRL